MMKILFYCFLILILPTVTLAQETTGTQEGPPIVQTEPVPLEDIEEKEEETWGWNDRISFFVGAGISIIANTVYELPVIDKTTNNVIIEESGKLKPNVSMGIVFTPFVYNIERKISYRDANGEKNISIKPNTNLNIFPLRFL